MTLAEARANLHCVVIYRYGRWQAFGQILGVDEDAVFVEFGGPVVQAACPENLTLLSKAGQ